MPATRYKNHGGDVVGKAYHPSLSDIASLLSTAGPHKTGLAPSDLPFAVMDPPKSATDVGLPGAWALDGSWMYFYSSTFRRWGRVALQQLIESDIIMGMFTERFSPKAPSSVSVGTASTLVADVNTNRRYLLISNDSADKVVYLGLNYPAVLNKGIRLNPGGASYEINFTNLYVGDVRAIVADGTANLTIQEG